MFFLKIHAITMHFKTVLFLYLLCEGFSTPVDWDSATVDFCQKEGQADYINDEVADSKNDVASLEDAASNNVNILSRLEDSAKAESSDASVEGSLPKGSYNVIPPDSISKQKLTSDVDKKNIKMTDQVADQSSDHKQIVKLKQSNEIVNNVEDYEKGADGSRNEHTINDYERQRRDAPKSSEQSTDDESVLSIQELIKKTISKLNDEELGQILDSLSEDKRQLLQTIMENDSEMKKREVVRKSGVVLESDDSEGNFNDHYSSDQSIANVVFSDGNQTPDSNFKSPETQNSKLNEKSKREVEAPSKEYGETSELTEEEEKPNPESFKVKRNLEPNYNIDELKDQAIYKQIKELEDSFPQLTAKSRNEESTKSPDSKMYSSGKFKRKDNDLSLKAGHEKSPGYRAENDDEDDDEGTEFEDDGFDDRTSNLASYDASATFFNDAKNE